MCIQSMRSVQSSLFVIFLLSAFVMGLSLTSCTKEALDPVHDVQWYKTHEGERKDMLAKCHNNPGQLAITPNCVNAEQAAREVLTTAPPLSDRIKPFSMDDVKK
jgi:hypothetical protein